MAVIGDIGKAAAQLHEMIAGADSAVVFTGAGISTESGIPDFRSPGGLWERVKPIMFDEFVASHEVRCEDWRRRFTMIDQILAAEPNAGHRAIARYVDNGRIGQVITQNIDGLHQRSGVPEERIVELHGNGTYATCLDCGRRYEFDALRP
ncbi:MAG: NAD-dependent deacetylase, partial [Hyphomicrobiales bacterium]|nr:NAD-dependent deacetylase [Hyphomicrobiales bacterium]